MNKIFLSGNLTRDPEIRYTQSGKAFARMGIAVNRPFSKEKITDFFNLVAWEKTAEFCGKYFTKGSRILVEGRLQTSNYENKDGVKVNVVDVVVDNVEFAGSKRSNDSSDENNNDSRFMSNDYSNRREQTVPSRRNPDMEIVGEVIDPEDTPF